MQLCIITKNRDNRKTGERREVEESICACRLFEAFMIEDELPEMLEGCLVWSYKNLPIKSLSHAVSRGLSRK
jgi:hypothetical protein